jgi:hypothetical protein
MRLGGSVRIREQDEEAAVGAQEEDWGSGKTTSSWSVARKSWSVRAKVVR